LTAGAFEVVAVLLVLGVGTVFLTVVGVDVVALDVGTVERGKGAFFAGANVPEVTGVDLGTTLRGGDAGFTGPVARLIVEDDGVLGLVVLADGALRLAVLDEAAASALAIRAFDAAVGADSLLAVVEPPVAWGLSGAAGGTTEGREVFADPDAVAFERVDGRDEAGGFVVFDEPEAVGLVAVDDATLGFAVEDVPVFDVVFTTLVVFSGGGLGVVGSLGAVACSGSVGTGTAAGSSDVTFWSFILEGVVSCPSVPASRVDSG
jgi:hypothetical protein